MKKRLLSLILTLAMLLVLFPTVVLGAAVSITIESTGITGCDSIVTDSITIAGLITTTVSRTYIKTIEDEDILTVVNETGILLSGTAKPPKASCLNTNGSLVITKKNNNNSNSNISPAYMTMAQVNKEGLIAAGLKAESFNTTCEKYHFFYFQPDGTPASGFALLIQVAKAEVKNTDKKTLEAEIDSVTGENAGKYYQENDRWNGKSASTNGFWTDMQPILTTAQTVLGNDKADQTMVDTAANNLEAAIGKLIPITQINPTALYEIIAECEKGYSENKDEVADPSQPNIYKQWLGDYTDSSASTYRSALAAAKSTLAGLFNGEGEPDVENNTAVKAAAVQATVDALKSARDNLLFQKDFNQAQSYSDAILALDREFPLAENSGFSTDSWSSFTEKRDAAKEYAQTYPIGGALTGTQASGYTTVLKDYWLACYNLIPTDNAAVSLRVSDAVGLADREKALSDISLATYNSSLMLDSSSGYTLKALLTKANITIPAESGQFPPTWLVYINGLLVRNPTYYDSETRLSILLENKSESKDIDWNDIQLKHGDSVQLVRIPQPQEYYYIHPINAHFAKLTSNFGQLRFADGTAKTAKEGGEIALTVERTSTYLINKNGVYTPRSGAELVVYGPKNSDGSWPNAPVHTGSVSDASGNVRLKLNRAGEYLVTAVDMRVDDVNSFVYPRLQAPAALVAVTIASLEASELAVALQGEKAQLDTFMAGVDADMLGNRWQAVETLYATAAGTISAAMDLKTAVDTLVLAKSQIQALINVAIQENVQAVSYFINNLALLPSVQEVANNLFVRGDLVRFQRIFDRYYNGGMSEYQKRQLTVEQAAQFKALEDAYYASGMGANLPPIDTYNIQVEYKDQNPADKVLAYSGIYNALMPESQNIIPGDSLNFYLRADSGKHGDELAYEIYGIQLLGKNGSPLENSSLRIARTDDIREASPGVRYYRLYTVALNMPRQDVTIRVLMRSKATDPVGIRNAALTSLTKTYQNYSKANYSNENWTKLTKAYNDGLTAIAAATDDQIETVKAAAMAAIAAVEKLGTTAGNETVGKYGSVTVTVENNTYSDDVFKGTFVNAEIPLNDGTTMMTAVLEALKKEGYGWTGTGGSRGENPMDITYLAGIKKGSNSLSEFDGGPQSGWMGTLNDWFVNESFQSFRVNASKSMYRLVDGDQIAVQYTKEGLGTDLGGTWNSAETSLQSLIYTGGNLTPAFTGGTRNYTMVLGSGNSVKFTPAASNKNYQVRTYLNTKAGDNWYRRGESINVKSGDVIYIGVGIGDWPSMNKQGAEAIAYSGTWYSITITDKNDPNAVIAMINSLPTITYAGYKTQTEQVVLARNAYDALTPAAKSNISQEILQKLITRENDIKKFKDIDNVKTLLSAIPAADRLTTSDKSKVQAAYNAYSQLSDEQRKYITVSDTKKYNDAVEWLRGQGIDTPDSIAGSDKKPDGDTVVLTPKATVKDGVAAAAVSASDMSKAISDAKKNGSGAIVIEPEVSGEARKSTVDLPRTSVSSMAADTEADLMVVTPAGSVTIPNGALASIAAQADGSGITIAVESVEAKTLSAEQQKAVSGGAVFDISILSNGKPIGSFGGKSVTISLPYTLKAGEKPEGVAVWYLNDAGKLERVSCKYDHATGLATFTTNHLSRYMVGYDAWTNPFTDVKAGDWYFDAVRYAAQKQLFTGTSATTFGPNTDMTRAMLVTALYRLEGKPAVTAANSFTDVMAGQWYTDAVLWANGEKLVEGYGNGLFGTNDPITREQVAAILYRYARMKGYDSSKTTGMAAYTDAGAVSTWAAPAMKWAVASGLITGTTATALSSGATASRAQVATMLMRFLESAAK